MKNIINHCMERNELNRGRLQCTYCYAQYAATQIGIKTTTDD